MALHQGYTEEKSKIIAELHENVDAAAAALKSTTVEAASKLKRFTDLNNKYTQNETNKVSAQKGHHLYEVLLHTVSHTEANSKHAVIQSQKIYEKVTEQLKLAYDSALITVDAAHITMELTKMITKTKVTHKLLSDLLTADVKNAETDAQAAVTDTIAALSTSITAAQSAISSNEFMKETQASLGKLVEKLKTDNLQSGLKGKLDRYIEEIKERGLKMEHSSKQAETDYNRANEKLANANAYLTLSQAAYNAALVAVNLGS